VCFVRTSIPLFFDVLTPPKFAGVAAAVVLVVAFVPFSYEVTRGRPKSPPRPSSCFETFRVAILLPLLAGVLIPLTPKTPVFLSPSPPFVLYTLVHFCLCIKRLLDTHNGAPCR
jgi:hypothetical protein